MSEILFIAVDPCILALVEDLQQLVEPTICVESDYTSGIKRIFDKRPAIVFLQHKIGSIACDKLANQVKMLLEGEAVPLVLLSDESVVSYSVVSTYEACFDFCLPREELSQKVQQLLHTLPHIDWKQTESAAAQSPEDNRFGPTLDISLPAAGPDFSEPFAWQAGGAPPPPDEGAPLSALLGDELPGTGRTEAPVAEEPLFLADFLEDRFSITPLSLSFAGSQLEDEATPYSAPAQGGPPTNDSPNFETEEPSPQFETKPDPDRELPFSVPKPIGPRPGKDAAPAAPRNAPAAVPQAGASAAAADSGAYATAAAAGSGAYAADAAPPPADTGAEARQPEPLAVQHPAMPAAAGSGTKKKQPWYFRGTVIGLSLLICIASLDLFFTLQHDDSKSNAGKAGPPPRNTPPPGTRYSSQGPLPEFIPQVPADPGYSVGHPGWERYQADALEYLVFREKGSVRAVQVLGQQAGAISSPFLKTCLRVSSGLEKYAVQSSVERNGIKVTTGLLINGGEVMIYQNAQDGEIRGFVISSPTASPAPAKGAKK